MKNNNLFEDGYKKYEAKAEEYAQNPEKTEGLLKKAIRKADEKKGSLSEVWDKFQLLIQLIKAWSKGEYTKIPKKSIVMIIATILYFVAPIDIVPDFIMTLGFLDDAAVIGFTLKQISTDLEEFRKWKED
ncbi:DUF1232 domain-containing protein [Cytobacillus spongiae]|jgi:uncharacterized membrane protein YkvA (DUF1232 family)|uniref:YkvA family protein n=1 Tax=Cytobacillus spongiae TaxID=2901381 RepID=UPI001F2259DD|nr:YkvA family protein [Cytobacillus spongiae]UII57134.1 DUF1232 domain-containing protein [Cytobacillus spongiae]